VVGGDGSEGSGGLGLGLRFWGGRGCWRLGGVEVKGGSVLGGAGVQGVRRGGEG